MYKSNLSKGRIAASARRGPPVQLDFESYNTREKSSKSLKNGVDSGDQAAEMSAPNPRPTFQKGRPMGNKKPSPSSQDNHNSENHLEMATLLSKQWKKVEAGQKANKDGESLYELYLEKDSKSLGNFQPFDLENYWEKKTLNNYLGKPAS
ncbi:uncharacterized protein LOC101846959 [Aplysia californica]|uniref:Uncharacterized protein LOC101846959 n=1 Tax=Aplysia californica TaxID=6500 RepID=A0ABM0JNN7_APLCA|nr:uncharacterized protein LOC101846959 [Aplysia californica]